MEIYVVKRRYPGFDQIFKTVYTTTHYSGPKIRQYDRYFIKPVFNNN